MPIEATSNSGCLTIKVMGDFNFSLHQSFRKAYSSVEPLESIIIDLKQTTFLDSSALGMMMAMQKSFSGKKVPITIQGCSSDVRKIFEIANMNQFFDIK